MITSILFSFLIAISPGYQSVPGDTLTLERAYQLAYENYPTAKKIALQHKITALNARIAQTGYYPQVTVKGRATYQSEVPEFPSPNPIFPTLSKDQYEVSLNVVQTIFNGGIIGIQKKLQKVKGQQQVNSIQVELYQIRRQVNQVYYGILLSQKQLKSTILVIENLEKQIAAIKSKVEHGVLLPSRLHVLKAELIKARQDSAAVRANIRAGYDILSLLVGKKISYGTELKLPTVHVNYRMLKPKRPRLDLFQSSLKVLETRQELAEAQKWPQLAAFGKFAYGRPGLNFLNDDFHGYYIIGLKLQWDFWDLINSDRRTKILQLKQQQIIQDRRAFKIQLNTRLERISENIETIKENIKRDKQIVALRKQIVEASASQLKHGVITASDYVTALTKLSQARLSLFLNRVKLSQAKVNYMTVLGVPLK